MGKCMVKVVLTALLKAGGKAFSRRTQSTGTRGEGRGGGCPSSQPPATTAARQAREASRQLPPSIHLRVFISRTSGAKKLPGPA